MSAAVRFQAAARREIQEARRWYDGQRPGLALEFADEVSRAISEIRESPRRYRIVHKTLRHAILRRFPYSVIYRESDQHIDVVAVFHHKRNPKDWMDR